MSKPNMRKSISGFEDAQPTKRFKSNVVSLDAYSSTIVLNETFMSTVQGISINRDIANIKTATAAMDLVNSQRD